MRLGREGLLAGALVICGVLSAQNVGMEKALKITVQVFDGRNGRPLADQRVLVFTGLSARAVNTHGTHTDVMTGKDGSAAVAIFPAETQWLQVFADGRVLCYPGPNQSTFRVETILSNGLATENTCGSLAKMPASGDFIVFARPAHFMERIKR
jgi:hypothetical protein